jgi:hypothetical protein
VTKFKIQLLFKWFFGIPENPISAVEKTGRGTQGKMWHVPQSVVGGRWPVVRKPVNRKSDH